MTQSPFRSLGLALAVSLFGLSPVPSLFAQAQAGATPPTRYQKILNHFDLGISAAGVLNGSVTGTTQNSTVAVQPSLTQSGSSAVGVLVSIRGEKSPYLGGEFNYTYSRSDQSFNFTPQGTGLPRNFKAQSTANEYTLGYLAKPPHLIFGAQPFLGGGAGSIEFKPTKNGGDGLPTQARAAYYYTAGAEAPVFDHVGLRLGFRQVFFLAPDFGQNYLKIKKYTSTLEPTVGFYLHF